MSASDVNRLMSDISRSVVAEKLSELTDRELLSRLNCGDEFALEAVVRRHGRMVLAAARVILGRNADIDDVFQATFLCSGGTARESARMHRSDPGYLGSLAGRR